MEERKRKDNAITLIALVISIIVLLILAGVSLSTIIGENGILDKSADAAEQSIIVAETEAITEQIVLANERMIQNPNGENKYYLGEDLIDRKLTNGNSWDIVIINDTKKVYGTDWTYIEKGTELVDYGESKYAWIVNYNTGEKIRLEEENYYHYDYTDSVAVTDGLILFMDSQVLYAGEKSLTEEEYESFLGEGVDLIGFETDESTGYLINDETSGSTSSTFNFDGEDDHINILFDDEESLNELYENGLTFEFYGKLNEGSHITYMGEDCSSREGTMNITRNIWIVEWKRR